MRSVPSCRYYTLLDQNRSGAHVYVRDTRSYPQGTQTCSLFLTTGAHNNPRRAQYRRARPAYRQKAEERNQGGETMNDMSLLILRLTTGGLLAGHGAQKLFGSFNGPGLHGAG